LSDLVQKEDGDIALQPAYGYPPQKLAGHLDSAGVLEVEKGSENRRIQI
jgi:hypothetical protein